MRYIVPAVINKNYTIPTIQNNFGREIEIVLTHIWDDVVEKLGIDDSDVYYVFDNTPRKSIAMASRIYDDKENNIIKYYLIHLHPNSINTFTIQNSYTYHMVDSIINTIAHEFRHIWQYKTNTYTENIVDLDAENFYDVYFDLPYEIDAREFADQYKPSDKIRYNIMCDIVQDRVYNNYNLSFFVNIHDFLTRELSIKCDVIPKLFTVSNKNIQYVQFMYHYDNKIRFEVQYNTMLVIHYNPCMFDFNSLIDRSLESIAMYICSILISMAHEYNEIDFVEDFSDTLSELIKLHFMQYIYTRK